LFEETGQVWQTDNQGVLRPPTRTDIDYAMHGGPAGYIAAVKGQLDILEAKMPELEQGVAEHRANYEVALKGR
jgi:hypothetical protein